jgi:superfamily II DNA/RNA helicase
VSDLLSLVEAIETDGKLETLSSLLTSAESGRTCIFTRFTDTASYLWSALVARDIEVHRVATSMPVSEQDRQFETFLAAAGVLLGTDDALEGRQLGPINVAIHYDAPASRAFMEARLNRAQADRSYAMRDDPGVLPASMDPWGRLGL